MERHGDMQGDEKSPSFTRRRVLQGAGCILAAAFPLQEIIAAKSMTVVAAKAVPADGSITAKLAAYMAAAAKRDLPEDVAEKTKDHILDTLAAMVSGAELPPAKIAVAFARAYGGEKVATVVGSDVMCGPIEAAMVNGMLAHSDETDDSHAPSRCHPGSAIVPATLAVGEKFGIDGTTWMRAVALGYDVGSRVTMTLGEPYLMVKNHRDTHQIAATFGSAAAAGCAAGLNGQQMRWMLDYAAQQASGINAWQRDTQHVEKSLCFGGFGARNGVTAALLISIGATGVEDIFSGSDNFFLAFAPDANPAGLIDKLGERYEVTRTNIKKWTVGSPIQAVLDCLENLRKRRAFDADEVRKVVVRIGTSGASITSNREMPDICLEHMVAIMLLDKTASFKASHDKPRMQDPAVLRQRAKVELIPDSALESFYPRREAIVELVFTDGTTLKERVDDTRGTLENPMTREEVVTKCQDLMADSLGTEKSKRLIEAVLRCETVKDIRTLMPLLQRTS